MRRRKAEGPTIYGGAYGRRLDSDWPEGVLGELDTQWKATDERVERARLLFEEVTFDDFEPLGSTGRRWLHRATGIEYVIDESQVVEAGDPRASGVEHFCIDGWTIVFFRPADFDRVERKILGTVVGGQLVRGRDGKEVLVPAKQSERRIAP